MISSTNRKKAYRYSLAEKDQVIQAYLDGVKLGEITRRYGPHSSRIYKWLRERGIDSRGAERGEARWNWKGGSRQTKDGYVVILFDKGHPFYKAMASKRGLVMEHRLVMAEHLGRPLLPHPLETVHHKNGITHDNRVGNLELMTGNHPSGVKLCCGECGSQNIQFDHFGGPYAQDG